MINYLWYFLIAVSIAAAVVNGNMEEVSTSIFKGALFSVELSIKLLGPMALWLGIMNIARKAKLTELISKLLKPIIKLFFPEIPEGHPASGAIIMNLTANMLGLGNSATPLGIEAMHELQKLNKNKYTASISMCTLLALNTSSLTIIPSTILSLRAASNSSEPAAILVTTLFATAVSTITAVLFDKVVRLYSGEEK